MNDTNQYKIIVLGDKAVGKTSLLERFVRDTFGKVKRETIGITIVGKEMKMNGTKVKIAFWDIDEISTFQMEGRYFNGACGIIIVFDVTRSDTIHSATKWCKKCTEFGLIHVPKVLVANKIDLHEDRKIEGKMGKDMAEKINAIYVEVSALNGDNVNVLFESLIHAIQETNG